MKNVDNIPIRKNSKVLVISGGSKGKTALVLETKIRNGAQFIKVQGCFLAKKSKKSDSSVRFIMVERFIPVCKVKKIT